MKRALLFGAIALWLLAAPLAAEEIVVPRFDISRILLEGNTILPSPEVDAILKKYTGPQKDFGTLQEAMDELEAAYRKRGYTMVTVILPEQELERGMVTINVVEPRVKEILIEGNRHYSRENILNALPTLKSGVPPKVTAISENLRAANENPARKLALQFKTGENDTDLKAVVQVSDQKPWRVTLSGDNTGSSTTGAYRTGRYRTGIGFQHFNLFDLDHMLALQYITSPDHFEEVQIFSGSYRLPLYRWGDTLDIFGAYSDVDSGTTQISGTDLSVSGKGAVAGFRYNMNLPRSGNYEQKLVGGMDYRLYDNEAVIFGQDLAGDVVAHPLSLTYGGIWSTDLLVLDGSLGLLYNIPWGNQGHKKDFIAVRDGAEADYTIVRYGASAMLRPGEDWILRLAGTGQYTPDRLIPGEQFGLGGSMSVRGYEEREESWDGGISGNLELYSPDLGRPLKLPQSQLRLVGFYDIGYGYNLRPQAGELRDHSLSGAGAGLRLSAGEYFNFSLDWGHAFKHSINTSSGENRIHFRAAMTY